MNAQSGRAALDAGDLSVVIVGYNSREDLRRCLHSLLSDPENRAVEIIAVDNASEDGSIEMLHAEFPGVRAVKSETNLGFAAANNVGIGAAGGRFVLLLNPDTVVAHGSLATAVAFMTSHPRAGIVGCRLTYPDGSIQGSAFSFPSIWNQLSEAVFLDKIFPRSRAFGRYRLSYYDYSCDLEVDWVSGAFMLIRRGVFETVGLLDDQFYMYSEEVDYCMRARKSGFEVWCTPQASAIHFWGGMSAPSRRTVAWVQRSQVLLYQKHYRGATKAFLFGIKYLTLAIRMIAYLLVAVVPGRGYYVRKSGLAGYALGKLLTSRWRYEQANAGSSKPWSA